MISLELTVPIFTYTGYNLVAPPPSPSSPPPLHSAMHRILCPCAVMCSSFQFRTMSEQQQY